MSSSRALNRRRFLRRVAGQGTTAELSCERLYMRYLEAAYAGRVPDFVSALRREIRDADEVRLIRCEWLARDEFRHALERGLGVALYDR